MAGAVQHLQTPFGRYHLRDCDGAIVAGGWRAMEGAAGSELLNRAVVQLRSYFAGELTVFDLPIEIEAPDLVRTVCAALSAIPFGETRTYGALAKELGQPAQGIGRACGRNPVAVIVPCHRVLGATGLGGFSAPGGVETKVGLLRLEGAGGLLI
ncbi:methylated-DNA--protein-cysteine methyltransferase [Pseudooceanicola batsensis HTCC2597]|uniref:Methylated-DNA--protein-cysteine methyltransferase n=1 Tax=Pseudooceanicola batsensis (strain ATCC BAA-863 / DSM 15984 / KCTC 12145 / HTCC2597) TaxID=252305 RepID=A3TSW6_PSEBH|nr:methylated-DNA--[protein]-cysteine S-methyltransferase [Pseudooceanicola batsensis]EAQ04743.1 methylated-DNA--protein-cysteine methyltransferase [Pseudooceanicola batsensis HTCC2597]